MSVLSRLRSLRQFRMQGKIKADIYPPGFWKRRGRRRLYPPCCCIQRKRWIDPPYSCIRMLKRRNRRRRVIIKGINTGERTVNTSDRNIRTRKIKGIMGTHNFVSRKKLEFVSSNGRMRWRRNIQKSIGRIRWTKECLVITRTNIMIVKQLCYGTAGVVQAPWLLQFADSNPLARTIALVWTT